MQTAVPQQKKPGAMCRQRRPAQRHVNMGERVSRIHQSTPKNQKIHLRWRHFTVYWTSYWIACIAFVLLLLFLQWFLSRQTISYPILFILLLLLFPFSHSPPPLSLCVCPVCSLFLCRIRVPSLAPRHCSCSVVIGILFFATNIQFGGMKWMRRHATVDIESTENYITTTETTLFS